MIHNQTEGRGYIINELGQDEGGLGAAEYACCSGNNGDKRCVGDFGGDGVDPVEAHRVSTGPGSARHIRTQGIAADAPNSGDPWDRLIAGGRNDAVHDTPGICTPADRTFCLRKTNTPINADRQFVRGWSHWGPVTGDVG